ncbi:MAG TPA: hypothetical protein VL463_06145 [Kofleriaceae bacterium]|jgi:hypothetical protein|nr:hypothetical protein [Kofleriaceae bacterium]
MSAAVGADIESLCSKCGDVWHVVVAKVGEEVVKVQCKQCGGYHRHRSVNGAPAAKKEPRPRVVRTPRPVVERFETPQVAADLTKPTRTYSPREKFAIGDRVEHPSFGAGVVEATPEPGKMTVFFPSGRKVLVHEKATGSGSLTRPPPFDHAKAPVGAGDAPQRVGRPSDLGPLPEPESDEGPEVPSEPDDESDESALDQNA